MVRPVEQELLEQIAVGGVELDAVESGLLRELGAAPELLDNGGNLGGFEGARKDQFRFGDLAIFVANRSVLERTQRRRRNRRDTPGIGRMRLTARVPHLQENAGALGVNGIDHALPALDLFLGVDPGRVNVSDPKLGHRRCIGNQQATVRGTLRVVLDHEVARDVARLGTHSRERREHHSVLQFVMSDFRLAKELAHDVILKECWVTPCWPQACAGSRGRAAIAMIPGRNSSGATRGASEATLRVIGPLLHDRAPLLDVCRPAISRARIVGCFRDLPWTR
jgi:hypothetical protein